MSMKYCTFRANYTQ